MSDPRTDPQAAPVTRRGRGAVVVGARILAGAIGTVAAAATIAAATWLPLPSHTAAPRSVEVTPVAAPQQRVCAGPMLRLGNDAGQDATTVSSVGQPTVRHGQTAGRATAAELSATDNSSGLAPELLTLPPASGQGSTIPLLGGSQTQVLNTGDLVGLASAECSEGSSDSWLVGGATDTGRTTLISLSNPSNVIATVSLTIFTESGPVAAAGTDGIVVPPGAQRVLSLAGFAPGATSPVVRVQSRGGQIVASLQQSTVRTLEPGGLDIVGASAGPSMNTVIPGLVMAGSAATAAREAEPGFSDLRTVVRVFVPGTKEAKIDLSVVPETGTTAPTTVLVDIEPGVVTDVPLDSFPDGTYTVTIASDQPVVAGARVSTVGSEQQSDFAWLSSASAIGSRALVAVAPGPAPVLHLANPTTKQTTATIRQTGGASVTVTVPGGKTVSRPLVASATYTVTGFDSLDLAVSYLGDGQLSGFTVSPSAPASQPITIYP
ncbi:MAG TPA: DUF5719 family protein [Lacisediminihabitans sp.]|uniref:DUF5719 family protein n=1 Tax=Lacisediminihabitans sp. TaxID=2787631 RepID=UPI002ED81C2C